MTEQEENRKQNAVEEHNAAKIARDYLSRVSLSFFAFSEKLSSSQYLRYFIIALLPVLVLLKYPADRVDYDLWWHMALGKYYVTHHTMTINHSIFSWTPTDPSWIYNTFLGSSAIYLFYNVMGGFGLWLMQNLVFLGVFLSFLLFLRLVRQRLDINSVVIIAAIAIACSPSCRYYKPELFSLLLFSWTAFIYYYVKVTRKIHLFYIYPLIFVLWVNLHGAFVVGLVFLAMAFVGEMINRIVFPRESFTNREWGHLGMAIVLCLVATLVNPYGVDYLLSTYEGITSDIYAEVNKKYILAYVSLWPYLKLKGLDFFNLSLTVYIMTFMFLVVICLFVYEAVKNRSCDFASLIIGVALYWKGMDTARATYFFIIIFFFIFFYLLIYRLKWRHFFNKATIFSLLIFIFFIANVSYLNIRLTTDNKWFGQGLDSFAPVKEAEFLKKYKMDGLLFNDYVIGGYLMWDLYPEYKVFIDPRCSPYIRNVLPEYMVFTNKTVNREDIRRFREKYPFDIVMLHYRQMSLIFDFLRAEGEEWRLLYFEKNAAILIHKSLLPIIKTEAGNVNLSPRRFKNVKNPEILMNVFNFYVYLNPRAGRYIYDIFRENISDCYKFKRPILETMDREIKNKEMALENKNMWITP